MCSSDLALTTPLLKSGAAIGEINCVRKHLSAIAGGRLALAARPARVVTLAISDVPGDDPSAIASGPSVPDPTTLADARAVLAKYAIAPSPAIARRLADPAAETPKPSDPSLRHASFAMIASPKASLDAAAALARASGYASLVLGDAIEGEAHEVAREHAKLARDIRAGASPVKPPCAIISGGETTVTVRGHGRGGRNVEYLLGLALALDGAPGIHALAGDTDGIDGTEDNAGALLGPDSLARARAKDDDAVARLDNNEGYGFFAALGDLVVTGPTLTEVFKEIDLLRTAGVEEPELRAARAYRRGLFPVQTATQAGLASVLNDVYVFGLPKDYPETYRSRIAAVTPSFSGAELGNVVNGAGVGGEQAR